MPDKAKGLQEARLFAMIWAVIRERSKRAVGDMRPGEDWRNLNARGRIGKGTGIQKEFRWPRSSHPISVEGLKFVTGRGVEMGSRGVYLYYIRI